MKQNPTSPIANAMNAQQLFEQRFQEKLRATPFPVEKITPTWAEHALSALRFASLLGLGISPQEWNVLLDAFHEDGTNSVTIVRSLDLYQFACLSNNLQARTPDELGMRLLAYGDLMAHADELVTVWQGLSNALRDEVENEVTTELQMKEAATGGGLRPVQPQA